MSIADNAYCHAGDAADACFAALCAIIHPRHGSVLHLAAQTFKALVPVLLGPGAKLSAAQRNAAQKLADKAAACVCTAVG